MSHLPRFLAIQTRSRALANHQTLPLFRSLASQAVSQAQGPPTAPADEPLTVPAKSALASRSTGPLPKLARSNPAQLGGAKKSRPLARRGSARPLGRSAPLSLDLSASDRTHPAIRHRTLARAATTVATHLRGCEPRRRVARPPGREFLCVVTGATLRAYL